MIRFKGTLSDAGGHTLAYAVVELVSSQNAGHALVFSGTQIKTDQHGYYEFSVKTGSTMCMLRSISDAMLNIWVG
ncbi:hypothetical protein [Vibrio penaeicida]|uniref:hypothetical protein n=1 Tax=Vibrio penaeicida TaxID=104609 RepID=UPI001CC73978|nr:hypothetical protein [Vibrio penaeicida]